jgi:hypothetical protein
MSIIQDVVITAEIKTVENISRLSLFRKINCESKDKKYLFIDQAHNSKYLYKFAYCKHQKLYEKDFIFIFNCNDYACIMFAKI